MAVTAAAIGFTLLAADTKLAAEDRAAGLRWAAPRFVRGDSTRSNSHRADSFDGRLFRLARTLRRQASPPAAEHLNENGTAAAANPHGAVRRLPDINQEHRGRGQFFSSPDVADQFEYDGELGLPVPIREPAADASSGNAYPHTSPQQSFDPRDEREVPFDRLPDVNRSHGYGNSPTADNPSPADGAESGDDLRQWTPAAIAPDDTDLAGRLPAVNSLENGLQEPLAEPPTLGDGGRGQLPPCPTPADLRRISDVEIDITPPPPQPEAQAVFDVPPDCPLGDYEYQLRAWAPLTYTWKASALCHKPLYFQDVALERYGHSWRSGVQPFVSGVKFVARLPILPYMMAMDPPQECVYELGHYRPGDCAPYMIRPIPISLRGAVAEAATWTGMVFLIP